ncbi:MAG: FoF1 ATP synthase subunit gamma [bacterium]
MSQLIQLRQKIKAIKNTQKITHAVRLVSMSLYAKLEKKHIALRYYMQNIKKLFAQTIVQVPKWKNPLLFPDDICDKNPLFVIVSTSKGLCGSLNQNLFHYIDQSLTIDPKQTPHFITIGKKAINFLQPKYPDNILCNYTELNSNNYTIIASDLIDKIMLGPIKFSSVTFYSSQLKNTFFVQMPKKSTLIPFVYDELEEKLDKNEKASKTTQISTKAENEDIKDLQTPTSELKNTDLIWEQDFVETLDYLATCYVKEFITNLLYQGLLAEQAARFIAMDGSTTNANKYLEKLTLIYNKQRQALITREVSELSAASAK